MEAALCKIIKATTGTTSLYLAPHEAIDVVYANPCASNRCVRNLNVAVVAAPCHGFGDVIFATKFARYLKYGLNPQHRSKPYSDNVCIVTTTPEMFKQLGVNDIEIVSLDGGQRAQCRRLNAFQRPIDIVGRTMDLIFVAPLMNDFEINYADIRKVFAESTPFNTIFLSEYQDDPSKGFNLTTGVGKTFHGLLFDGQKPSRKLKAVGATPYAFAYLAKDVGIASCLSSFAKMVISKYCKTHPRFQIVLPGDWGVKQLSANASFIAFVRKHYSKLVVKTKAETATLFHNNAPSTTVAGKVLTLRGDILPLPRPDMLSLIKHSVSDILTTGDQSITDVIDCCQMKNIWYQTVPWKRDFARALAKELPQKFLSDSRTSCGSLKAVKWNRTGSDFKSKHDFRKKAKRELDIIFLAASEAKRPDSIIHRYLTQLDKSKSRNSLVELLTE